MIRSLSAWLKLLLVCSSIYVGTSTANSAGSSQSVTSTPVQKVVATELSGLSSALPAASEKAQSSENSATILNLLAPLLASKQAETANTLALEDLKQKLSRVEADINSKTLELKELEIKLAQVESRANGRDSFLSVLFTGTTVTLTVFALLLAILGFWGFRNVQSYLKNTLDKRLDERLNTLTEAQIIPMLDDSLNNVLVDPEDPYDEQGQIKDISKFQVGLEHIVSRKVSQEVSAFIYRGVGDDD
jgi:cytochrome bd-type quinol oxidase subunit 1